MGRDLARHTQFAVPLAPCLAIILFDTSPGPARGHHKNGSSESAGPRAVARSGPRLRHPGGAGTSQLVIVTAGTLQTICPLG